MWNERIIVPSFVAVWLSAVHERYHYFTRWCLGTIITSHCNHSALAGEVSSVIIVFELASLWRCFWKHFHELFFETISQVDLPLNMDIWATAAFVAVTVMPSSTIKMFLIPLDSSVQKGVERKTWRKCRSSFVPLCFIHQPVFRGGWKIAFESFTFHRLQMPLPILRCNFSADSRFALLLMYF